MKRYALLDTDFISKTHSVQDDNGNHLIDRVMELPEYEFFCHAQIVTELNRYNADTPIWLSEKVGAQKIKSYTDQEILESLSLVRGPLACATYTQMLKLACDRKIAEVQDKIEQSKAEEAAQSVVPGTVRAAAEQAENFLHGTRLTASMVSAFIENVYVHEGGRIVVQFKYEQSIQDAVRALHTD